MFSRVLERQILDLDLKMMRWCKKRIGCRDGLPHFLGFGCCRFVRGFYYGFPYFKKSLQKRHRFEEL